MVSPHLLRDLRLLHAVLVHNPTARASFEDLFAPVFHASTLAAVELLKSLCHELEAGPSGTVLPCLELVDSPKTNLGIRSAHSVARGQLLCIYPGRIFASSESTLPPGDQLFTNEYENVHMDLLSGGFEGWFPSLWQEHELLKNRKFPGPMLWHGNRLAVGNLLNHPAADQRPNCVPMVFRWPNWQELQQSTPAFWARLIPHVVMGEQGRLARTPSGIVGQEATFPAWPHMGMAFFALRGLRPGEELLLNYRLSPPFPSWYAQGQTLKPPTPRLNERGTAPSREARPVQDAQTSPIPVSPSPATGERPAPRETVSIATQTEGTLPPD
eukprot:symbB.v1.2.005082.t1/scaffold234.1/size257806/1